MKLNPAVLRRRKANASIRPRKPVIGLEAEFTLFVREQKRLPEHVFRNPQAIVRERMIPRSGRSFHLPSGGALYFDTGVVEVATPIIEIEPHCCVRGVRSLWEQIEFVRGELDEWEAADGRSVRLEGFSTHYNVSIPAERGLEEAGISRLALLLAFILPVPVMLLAANKMSTGVGVRPREDRIEITVDFTSDPELMLAAASVAVGITLAVAQWPSHDLSELQRRGFPVITPFYPRKHTSRKGWLARFDCFERNPFNSDVNVTDWPVTTGGSMSLRQIAHRICHPFFDDIARVTDLACLRHIGAVLKGNARSLLDFEERPAGYRDAGRRVEWRRRSLRTLPRSDYEAVIHRIITHRKLRVGSSVYIPEKMKGWYEVVFRNAKTGLRRIFNLDDLVEHCSLAD